MGAACLWPTPVQRSPIKELDLYQPSLKMSRFSSQLAKIFVPRHCIQIVNLSKRQDKFLKYFVLKSRVAYRNCSIKQLTLSPDVRLFIFYCDRLEDVRKVVQLWQGQDEFGKTALLVAEFAGSAHVYELALEEQWMRRRLFVQQVDFNPERPPSNGIFGLWAKNFTAVIPDPELKLRSTISKAFLHVLTGLNLAFENDGKVLQNVLSRLENKASSSTLVSLQTQNVCIDSRQGVVIFGTESNHASTPAVFVDLDFTEHEFVAELREGRRCGLGVKFFWEEKKRRHRVTSSYKEGRLEGLQTIEKDGQVEERHYINDYLVTSNSQG